MKDSRILKFISAHSWIIIIFAALLPYLNSFDGGFVFDDIFLVEHDRFYETKPFMECWKRPYWSADYNDGLYRPLVTMSFWLNTRLADKYSPAFRAVNIFLNIVVCLILFKLLKSLGYSFLGSFFATLLFAVHPLHSEAVIPASGRADMLCAFFVFLGLFLHIRSCKTFSQSAENEYNSFSNKIFYCISAGICICFSLWSKENGIILLPLFIIYDAFFVRKRFMSNLVSKKYLFYLLALFIALLPRLIVMGNLIPKLGSILIKSDNVLALCSYPVRAATAIKLQGYAIWKFLFPVKLSHDYSYAQILPLESFFDIGFLGALILIPLSCILLLILKFLGKDRYHILLLILFYAVSIFPTSNLVFLTGTIFGERLYYLPSAWLCAISGIVIRRSILRWNCSIATIIFLSALLLLGYRTWQRGEDWSSQLSLAIKGVETSPKSSKMWQNLALQFFNHGNYEEASIAAKKALEILPEEKNSLKLFAYSQINLGNYSVAESALRELIISGTKNFDIYNKLSAILASKGELEEAKKLWTKSLEINPQQPIIKKYLEENQQLR